MRWASAGDERSSGALQSPPRMHSETTGGGVEWRRLTLPSGPPVPGARPEHRCSQQHLPALRDSWARRARDGSRRARQSTPHRSTAGGLLTRAWRRLQRPKGVVPRPPRRSPDPKGRGQPGPVAHHAIHRDPQRPRNRLTNKNVRILGFRTGGAWLGIDRRDGLLAHARASG